MKLYYSPGTCSLAPHIVLREAAVAFELERVDTATHRTESGDDFFAINPKGSVPVLQLDDGSLLTEGPVITQYISDVAGNRGLMPIAGSTARYRVMEWQNYITSELHKFFWPLFHLGAADESVKDVYRRALAKKFAWVSSELAGKSCLTGEQFTASDAYLFAVTNWTKPAGVDISQARELQEFMARVAARPAVKKAMEAEGLVKKTVAEA